MVVEDGVVVLDSRAGTALRLGYPEALVWDMAGRGRSPREITDALGAALALPPPSARRRVLEMLEQWTRAGLLVEVPAHG